MAEVISRGQTWQTVLCDCGNKFVTRIGARRIHEGCGACCPERRKKPKRSPVPAAPSSSALQEALTWIKHLRASRLDESEEHDLNEFIAAWDKASKDAP